MTKITKKWKNPGSVNSSNYSGLYRSWKNMLVRSGNKDGKNPTYSDVTVCREWYDYDVFFEWAIENGWKKGLCLDKDSIIPGNREYKPEACKWVSRGENSAERNKRIPTKISGNNPFAKKVQCVETGKIYECCRDAERELNIPFQSVSSAANPKCIRNKLAGGYHWKYLED